MNSTCQPSNDNSFGPAVIDCRQSFDFTLLFEQSTLSIGPSALFLLFVTLRISQLLRSDVKTLPSQVRLIKAITAFSLVALQIAQLVLWNLHRGTRASVPSAALTLVDAIAIFLLSALEHSRTVRPSLLLNVYLFISLLFDITQTRTLYIRGEVNPILGVSTAIIGVKVALLLLESHQKRSFLRAPYRNYPPEAVSGIFSQSFLFWVNPLFVAGFRKILSLDDLFSVDQGLSSRKLQKRMRKSWNYYRSSRRHSLVRASIRCLWWPLCATIFPRLCLIGFNYAQPFLISKAITYVGESATEQNKNVGYGLIAATGFIYLGIAISTVHYKHRLFRMITMFRGAMASLIYDRTLDLQVLVYDESAALTLMSSDIDAIVGSLQQIIEMWARIIEVAIGIWLLERQLGWVCVAPVVVVTAGVFGSARIAKFMGRRQKQWVQAIQKRVSITSSILGSMKGVKMMGLSDTAFAIIQGLRIHELNQFKEFRILMICRNAISVLPFLLGPLSVFVIFSIITTVHGSERLSTVQAFTSFAIISILTIPAQALLASLPTVMMASGCFDRIQEFLLCQSRLDQRNEDIEIAETNDGIELLQFNTSPLGSKAIVVDNASIQPSPKATFSLHEINLSIGKGSLVFILGPVGSGKSIFLKAILGELPCESGSIQVASKSMAFCSQSIWLQNSTIRHSVCGTSEEENIDLEWFNTVMRACALDGEILQLPDGYNTAIGSRGLNLSGGQKQRLAIARAVYARKDIVLLDDIFSALDSATEERIVNNLLREDGIFRNVGTTVILATNTIRNVHLADHVLVLNSKGFVEEQGTFDFLRARGGYLSRLLAGTADDTVQRGGERTEQQTTPSQMANKKPVVKGPTVDNFADLTRKTGDTAVYKYYLSSISWKLIVAILTLMASYTFFIKFQQVWLKWYTEGTVNGIGLFTGIYAVLALSSTFVLVAAMIVYFLRAVPQSSANLHHILLRTVMRAPQSFFNKTDTGVTLNRFSQDMTLVDNALPGAAITTTTYLMTCIAESALISIGSSYMALTIPLLLLAVFLLQNLYLRTSRQIRYLDLEAKSPLYSHFLETIEGLPTIRAFGWQRSFSEEYLDFLDSSQKPYYLLYCIQRWLNLVLDLIVCAMAVIVVTLAFQLRGTTSGGLLGISLNAVLSFNGNLQGFITSLTSLETSLGAIARLKTFEAETVPEDKAEETFVPDPNWPDHGAIEFQNVSASYGPSMQALTNISLKIASGEKIGICGRTGSGKSSLLYSLVRLIELDGGTIKIDDVDLNTVPREVIRSRIVAIPQDALFLTGTVRFNANPNMSASVTDELITNALTKTGLWPIIEDRGGLDGEMNAQLLSQGQQQLFSLARAMLRRGSRILILDEATSSVDGETDQLMQKLIREEFASHTILTVTHRVDTMMDSDRIAVIEGGRLVECGKPRDLISRSSVFRALHQG